MNKRTILMLATLACLSSVAIANGQQTMEQKRQAEIAADATGGRELEARPGKTVKGSELADAAKIKGLQPGDDIKWVRDELLGQEFAVNLTLARQWKEVLGGTAPSWTGKIAPQIKPGTVITSENYKTFADLDKLLPPQTYARLAPGAWDPIKEIKVGETDQFFPTREYIAATQAGGYSPQGFTIKNWKGGLPFPHSKDGEQVLLNYLYRYWVDDLTFGFKWYLIGASNNLERTITGRMFGMRFNGRTLTDKRPAYDEANAGVLEKIGTLIESPKDVRGLALSRTRHVDNLVPDTIQYYLPALRRVRRLSGRDTQDPIAGTDITWDDYVGFYQQVSGDTIEVKLVGEGEILHPSSYTKPTGNPHDDYLHNASAYDKTDMTVRFAKWQRRPVWIIDVNSKDPSYMYRTRRLWIDKELPNILHYEALDRKGNHWKSMRNSMTYYPTNGDGANWDWASFADDIGKHRTSWIFEWTSLPGLTPDDFDTALLTKKTQ